MPISEKIQNEIHKLNIPEDEKKLLFELLETEDRVGYRYQGDYLKLIKDYLSKREEE